ncbi:Cna B-type domain-containing protein, partial [bacterium 1xD42-67]
SQDEGDKTEPDGGSQDEGDKTEPDSGPQDEGDKTEPDGGSQDEGGKAEPDGGSSDGADAPAAGEEQEATQEEHRIVRALKNTRTLGFSLEVTYPDAVAESTDGGKTTYKVTASGVTITKPQKGGIDDGGRGYSFVVTGPDGTEHVTTLKAGETKTVDGLGTGIYTVEEVDTAHTAIFRTPGNVVYANEIDVPTVVIINNYRPKEFGAYRVVHEYYKNSVAAENLQGRSEIAVVADLPLDGTAYVKEENPNAVEQPDFKGTTYKYDSVVYGTMEEGDRYSPDSTMTGVTATEDGGEIIILRYVRSTNPTSHETRLTVRKVWKGDEAKDRPEEIKVKIFRDGEDWKTIVLTARDGWRWSDSVANAEHTYQVEEVAGGEIEGAYIVDNGQPVELKVDGSATITITNTKKDPEKGDLTIAKTVAGGSTEQAFQFTVVLSDTTVSGTVDGVAFTDGKAAISLRHGESRTIHGLPAGIEYSVTETGAEGYTVTAKGETGIVPAGGEVKAEFVNSLDSQPQTGGLTIAKTVTGIGDQERRFTFTVILSDSSISGTFGGMEFTGGTASIQLRSGESVSASGLPAGVRYTVTESGANEKGYITTASGEAGTIPAGGSASVSFTNHVPEDHTPQWDPEEEEWEYIDDDEVPLSDTDPEPQTGDGSLTRLWAAVCVVSLLGGAALILTAIFKKKS